MPVADPDPLKKAQKLLKAQKKTLDRSQKKRAKADEAVERREPK